MATAERGSGRGRGRLASFPEVTARDAATVAEGYDADVLLRWATRSIPSSCR